ncbi:NlpC/P60 family protein [Latilactobacillus sakei]
MLALSQIGTPYVWGGSTPGVGLDCSGLVQYAYSRAGVSLGRITTAQEGAWSTRIT